MQIARPSARRFAAVVRPVTAAAMVVERTHGRPHADQGRHTGARPADVVIGASLGFLVAVLGDDETQAGAAERAVRRNRAYGPPSSLPAGRLVNRAA